GHDRRPGDGVEHLVVALGRRDEGVDDARVDLVERLGPLVEVVEALGPAHDGRGRVAAGPQEAAADAGDRLRGGGGDQVGARRAEPDDDDGRAAAVLGHHPTNDPVPPSPRGPGGGVTRSVSGSHEPYRELTDTSASMRTASIAACTSTLPPSSSDSRRKPAM